MLGVAVGHQDHFAATLFVALAIAISGADVMLRDIVAASVWD